MAPVLDELCGLESPLPRGLLDLGEEEVLSVLQSLAAEAKWNVENKAFSDCRYISCKPLGLSVRLTPAAAGTSDCVFLYNEGVDGFSAYKLSDLPSELKWSDLGKDVVGRLGEPSEKFGAGRQPVGISYELSGIDIHFEKCTWDDPLNPIRFLGVFHDMGGNQAYDLCVRCAKQGTLQCGRCGLVRYCSSDCQKVHWTQHKTVCDQAQLARADPLKDAIKAALAKQQSGPKSGEITANDLLTHVTAKQAESTLATTLGEMD